MIYIVAEGKIVKYPDAVSAKASGSGHVVHVIGPDNKIIGNFPMKIVKFFGEDLPEIYNDQLREQERWAAMTPDERAKEKARLRGGPPGPAGGR